MAATAVLFIVGAHSARSSIRSGSYVHAVPDRVLIMLERPGQTLDYRLQRELSRRFERGELSQRNIERLITAAAAELDAPITAWDPTVDDYQDRRRARNILADAWPASRPALESLLVSQYWNARCFATEQIWKRSDNAASPDLLQATVDQLRDDQYEPGRYYRGGNAKRAVARLVPHLDAALPMIENALDSEDPQQRLLAALIIASEHAGNRQRDATFVLVESLRANKIGGDAMVAASGLARAGRIAGPALDHGRRSDDPQQAAWCSAIADLHAGLPWERIEPRLEPYRLTLRTRRPLGRDTVSSANMIGY
jgi:hypothetical protein